MKLTKSKLKSIIKEELLKEYSFSKVAQNILDDYGFYMTKRNIKKVANVNTICFVGVDGGNTVVIDYDKFTNKWDKLMKKYNINTWKDYSNLENTEQFDQFEDDFDALIGSVTLFELDDYDYYE